MSSILDDLRKYIFQSESNLQLTVDVKSTLSDFLSDGSAATATKLFGCLGRGYQKGNIFQYIETLKVYETHLGKLLAKYRNHYIHSAGTYAIGLAIYNNVASIRKNINRFTENSIVLSSIGNPTESFQLRWAVASCLHDIGYPLEMCLSSFNEFATGLIQQRDDTNPRVQTEKFLRVDWQIIHRMNILPLLELREPYISWANKRKDTALNLIAWNLSEFPLLGRREHLTYDTLAEAIKRYVEDNFEKGWVDHGIFSAIITLSQIHKLYRKKGWDSSIFYFEIVDASATIFLHNCYQRFLMQPPYEYGKFRVERPSPLGYLLSLSDILAEWSKDENCPGADAYKLDIGEDMISIEVPASMAELKSKITDLFNMDIVKIEVVVK